MTSTGVPRQTSMHSQTGADVIGRAEALSRVDGDSELLVSLIDIFLTESERMMEEIRTAVKSGDSVKIEKAAHRFKGSVSMFGAEAITQVAFELEKKGRSGDLRNTAENLAQLEQLMAALEPALKQFRSELQSSS